MKRDPVVTVFRVVLYSGTVLTAGFLLLLVNEILRQDRQPRVKHDWELADAIYAQSNVDPAETLAAADPPRQVQETLPVESAAAADPARHVPAPPVESVVAADPPRRMPTPPVESTATAADSPRQAPAPPVETLAAADPPTRVPLPPVESAAAAEPPRQAPAPPVQSAVAADPPRPVSPPPVESAAAAEPPRQAPAPVETLAAADPPTRVPLPPVESAAAAEPPRQAPAPPVQSAVAADPPRPVSPPSVESAAAADGPVDAQPRGAAGLPAQELGQRELGPAASDRKPASLQETAPAQADQGVSGPTPAPSSVPHSLPPSPPPRPVQPVNTLGRTAVQASLSEGSERSTSEDARTVRSERLKIIRPSPEQSRARRDEVGISPPVPPAGVRAVAPPRRTATVLPPSRSNSQPAGPSETATVGRAPPARPTAGPVQERDINLPRDLLPSWLPVRP
jgi:hypothetical protein